MTGFVLGMWSQSEVSSVLHMKNEDVLILVAGAHFGTNLDVQTDQYVCKRKSDGGYVIEEDHLQIVEKLALKQLANGNNVWKQMDVERHHLCRKVQAITFKANQSVFHAL